MRGKSNNKKRKRRKSGRRGGEREENNRHAARSSFDTTRFPSEVAKFKAQEGEPSCSQTIGTTVDDVARDAIQNNGESDNSTETTTTTSTTSSTESNESTQPPRTATTMNFLIGSRKRRLVDVAFVFPQDEQGKCEPFRFDFGGRISTKKYHQLNGPTLSDRPTEKQKKNIDDQKESGLLAAETIDDIFNSRRNKKRRKISAENGGTVEANSAKIGEKNDGAVTTAQKTLTANKICSPSTVPASVDKEAEEDSYNSENASVERLLTTTTQSSDQDTSLSPLQHLPNGRPDSADIDKTIREIGGRPRDKQAERSEGTSHSSLLSPTNASGGQPAAARNDDCKGEREKTTVGSSWEETQQPTVESSNTPSSSSLPKKSNDDTKTVVASNVASKNHDITRGNEETARTSSEGSERLAKQSSKSHDDDKNHEATRVGNEKASPSDRKTASQGEADSGSSERNEKSDVDKKQSSKDTHTTCCDTSKETDGFDTKNFTGVTRESAGGSDSQQLLEAGKPQPGKQQRKTPAAPGTIVSFKEAHPGGTRKDAGNIVQQKWDAIASQPAETGKGPASAKKKSPGCEEAPHRRGSDGHVSGSSVEACVRDVIGCRPRSNSTDGELNLPQRGLCDERMVLESYRWNPNRLDVLGIPKGFRNLGNTCFLNSTLQCLVYLPPFCQSLMAISPPDGKNVNANGRKISQGKHITLLLRSLFHRAHSATGNSVVKPQAIVMAVPSLTSIGKQTGYRFRPGRQEDAHEFLVHLLDAMNDGELREAGINQHKSGWRDRLPIPRLDETTFIHRIFGGYLRSQVYCTSCGYKSNTYDPFLNLSLEVSLKSCVSIRHAFAGFTRKETLDSENRWKCSGCKKRVCATKQLTVFRPPLSLCIQLKRFAYGGMGGCLGGVSRSPMSSSWSFGGFGGGGSKISKPIEFPARMDLPLSDGRSCAYALTGIVIHVGGSASSGHYTAYVKKPAHRGAGDQWFHMDDAFVQAVSERTVLQQRDAYLLFYCRQEVKLEFPEPPIRTSMSAEQAMEFGRARSRARANSLPESESPVGQEIGLRSQKASDKIDREKLPDVKKLPQSFQVHGSEPIMKNRADPEAARKTSPTEKDAESHEIPRTVPPLSTTDEDVSFPLLTKGQCTGIQPTVTSPATKNSIISGHKSETPTALEDELVLAGSVPLSATGGEVARPAVLSMSASVDKRSTHDGMASAAVANDGGDKPRPSSTDKTPDYIDLSSADTKGTGDSSQLEPPGDSLAIGDKLQECLGHNRSPDRREKLTVTKEHASVVLDRGEGGGKVKVILRPPNKSRAWKPEQPRGSHYELLGNAQIGKWDDDCDADNQRSQFMAQQLKAESRKRKTHHLDRWDAALDAGKKKKARAKSEHQFQRPGENTFQREQNNRLKNKGRRKGHDDYYKKRR